MFDRTFDRTFDRMFDRTLDRTLSGTCGQKQCCGTSSVPLLPSSALPMATRPMRHGQRPARTLKNDAPVG